MEELVLRNPGIFGEYEKGSKYFDDFGIDVQATRSQMNRTGLDF